MVRPLHLPENGCQAAPMPTEYGAGMTKINRVVVDCTAASSELCRLGAEYGTDKSPYSTTWHHHPYTAVYDLLFADRRYSPITLGELGILENSSIRMWRSYFTQAQIFGFEVSAEKVAAAQAECLPGTHYYTADVTNRASMFQAFNKANCLFDILIDDSTHLFDHQIAFVEVAMDFVKPGGMIVIEDVFRGWDETRYSDALSQYVPYFSNMTFIETNHAAAFSGGTTLEPYFNNDKILVMYRNEVTRRRSAP